MLRRQVGDSLFFEGVRRYYHTWKDRNALTENFQKAMEETSGQNLEMFFRQWLYQTPIPRLQISWQYQQQAVVVTVNQVQEGPIFNLNLELALVSAQGAQQRVFLPITQKSQTFRLPVPAKPERLVPDPDVHLLFEEVKGK
jgi:aminopeptidase N